MVVGSLLNLVDPVSGVLGNSVQARVHLPDGIVSMLGGVIGKLTGPVVEAAEWPFPPWVAPRRGGRPQRTVHI